MIKTIKEMRDEINKILDDAEVKPVDSGYPDNLMEGWVILHHGSLQQAISTLHAKRSFNQGNWFATKEEAELEVRRRAVIQKMRAYGFKPDWKNPQQHKCGLLAEQSRGICIPNANAFQGEGLFEVYFETIEQAEACVKALGDEILEVLR